MLGVAGSLEKDVKVCRELDAAVVPQLEQLRIVYRLIDACAKHVAEVDRAVTAMENAGKWAKEIARFFFHRHSLMVSGITQ